MRNPSKLITSPSQLGPTPSQRPPLHVSLLSSHSSLCLLGCFCLLPPLLLLCCCLPAVLGCCSLQWDGRLQHLKTGARFIPVPWTWNWKRYDIDRVLHASSMELWPHVELGHSQYTHTPNETNENKTLEIILWSLRHHSIVVGASNSTWRIFSNLCLCLGELLLLTLDKSATWAATRIHRAEIYGSSGDLQSSAHVTTLEDSHLKLYTWSQQIHHEQEFAAWGYTGYTTNGCTVKIPSTNPKAQSGSHTEIEILNWDYFFHMKPHETTDFSHFGIWLIWIWTPTNVGYL